MQVKEPVVCVEARWFMEIQKITQYASKVAVFKMLKLDTIRKRK